jgi:hypothetical protein
MLHDTLKLLSCVSTHFVNRHIFFLLSDCIFCPSILDHMPLRLWLLRSQNVTKGFTTLRSEEPGGCKQQPAGPWAVKAMFPFLAKQHLEGELISYQLPPSSPLPTQIQPQLTSEKVRRIHCTTKATQRVTAV